MDLCCTIAIRGLFLQFRCFNVRDGQLDRKKRQRRTICASMIIKKMRIVIEYKGMQPCNLQTKRTDGCSQLVSSYTFIKLYSNS